MLSQLAPQGISFHIQQWVQYPPYHIHLHAAEGCNTKAKLNMLTHCAISTDACVMVLCVLALVLDAQASHTWLYKLSLKAAAQLFHQCEAHHSGRNVTRSNPGTTNMLP
jgi:hypothetical protein